MILIDTSIWIDHLHRTEPDLVELLDAELVAQHPMVVGELALGTLRARAVVLEHLRLLPSAAVASHAEVDQLVEARRLYGRGLSLVDAHLLASVLLGPRDRLWTRDKRLHHAAQELGVAF
jgi:predicted nucleic acid-binding protein